MKARRFLIVVLAVSLSLAAGCSKSSRSPSDEPDDARDRDRAEATEATEAPDDAERRDVGDPFAEGEVDRREIVEPEPTSADVLNRQGVLETVYFAFDRDELSDDARSAIQRNATWLRNNPGYGVVVEGHADERGTIEYNLALGERRASSVRDYLVSLGVERDRIRIVTYGEERPAVDGRDESAWSRNRRAEFVLEDR